MANNSIQRTVVFSRELTGFGQGVADWAAVQVGDGGPIRIFDLNISALRQAMLEDKNYRRRAGGEFPMFGGLKNGQFSFSFYRAGNPATPAAAGVQAGQRAFDELLFNAFGGESRGFAAAITGGTALIPTVTAANVATQDQQSWGFFRDISAPENSRFRRFTTTTTGNMTLATGHQLPFVPVNGDVMTAAVVHNLRYEVIENNANNSSHTFLAMGQHVEDSIEARGVAFAIPSMTIEAGVPVELPVTALCASIVDMEGITQTVITEVDQGQHAGVVGSGQATICEFANVGSNLASVQFTGQIAINFGIERDPMVGPNGLEGVHGYGITPGSYSGTTVDVTVDFDDNNVTQFRAGTEKHLLVQIGTGNTLTHGVYFPRLAWREEPERVDVNGRVYHTLRFKALEPEDDVSALSGSEVARVKAKFSLLRVG